MTTQDQACDWGRCGKPATITLSTIHPDVGPIEPRPVCTDRARVSLGMIDVGYVQTFSPITPGGGPMSDRTAYRLPMPGDLVTLTGATLYRVTEVADRGQLRDDSYRDVTMTSERSGRRYRELLGRLWWPGCDGTGMGDKVVPPVPGRPHSGPRRPDVGASAAVISWDTPATWEDRPSYVGACVARDDQGRRFLHVAADGPEGDAYLDRAAARVLVGQLCRFLGQL